MSGDSSMPRPAPTGRGRAESSRAGQAKQASQVTREAPTGPQPKAPPAGGPVKSKPSAPDPPSDGTTRETAPGEAGTEPSPAAALPAGDPPPDNSAVRPTETVVASPAGAVVTAAIQPGAGAVRKARLTVAQLDPWSVMKMSFLLSLAGGIILIVAVWLLWLLLSGAGVFISVDKTVGDIAGSGSSISVVDILSLRRVMGIALMIAVMQVVLVTALATLAAFLYNLSAGLVGGFEVTLTEDS